jgi:hypothetical protein
MPWRLHRILTTTADSGRWTMPGPCRFTPRESAPGIHCRGGCVGHIVGLDAYGRQKLSYPHRGSIPGPSNPQRVVVPTELSWPPHLCSSLAVTEVKQRKKNNKRSVQYGVTACECFCSHNSSGPLTFSSHRIMEDNVTKTRGKTD